MLSTWTLWNLFLAAVPVLLAQALARTARWARVERRRLALAAIVPLGLLWLAFLPNACYLMTEWRHFLFNPHFQAVRETTNPNDLSALRVAKQAAFLLAYSGFGMACFALSIRPIVRALKCWSIRPVRVAVPFFVLVSLGVYLGLIVRLNSWDLALRPTYVAFLALRALVHPTLLAVILGYAAVLAASYVFCDIWIDGLKLRMHRLRWARS
ncbi:MAG: putative rane protein [Planctomycetota bacterium]|nr:putative rane protein [Planctomycetota bacterium]